MKKNASKINWLSRVSGMNKEIESLRTAKAKAQQEYSDSDRTRQYIKTLDKKIKRLDFLRNQTLEAIYTLPNSTQRTILIEKYINGKNWDEIAEQINYSKTQAQRLHGVALEAFAVPKKMARIDTRTCAKIISADKNSTDSKRKKKGKA